MHALGTLYIWVLSLIPFSLLSSSLPRSSYLVSPRLFIHNRFWEAQPHNTQLSRQPHPRIALKHAQHEFIAEPYPGQQSSYAASCACGCFMHLCCHVSCREKNDRRGAGEQHRDDAQLSMVTKLCFHVIFLLALLWLKQWSSIIQYRCVQEDVFIFSSIFPMRPSAWTV